MLGIDMRCCHPRVGISNAAKDLSSERPGHLAHQFRLSRLTSLKKLALHRKSVSTCQHTISAASGTGFGTVVQPKAKKPKNKKRLEVIDSSLPIWETSPKICACGSKRLYTACCEKYHCGEAYPLTPEALMRTRFSAYVKHQVDFLIESTHEENKAQEGSKLKGETVSTLREDLHATCDKVRWLKLQMLQNGTGPGADDNEAFVAFSVRFKFRNQAGQRQKGTRLEQITERSRFLRDPSTRKWSYVDGDTSWQGHKYS